MVSDVGPVAHKRRCGRSSRQQHTVTIVAIEQALQLLLKVVNATPLDELRVALSPYSFECMAINLFFTSQDDHPWTHTQWMQRSTALRRLAKQLAARLNQARVTH